MATLGGMELSDAFSQIASELKEKRDLLQSLEEKAREIRLNVDRLTQEQRVLEGLLQRFNPGHPPPAGTAENPWINLGRSDAVERVLIEAGEQVLSPSDIAGALRAHGREGDTSNYVSASLSYLQDKGRATQIDRGRWMAPKTAQNRVQGQVGRLTEALRASIPNASDLAGASSLAGLAEGIAQGLAQDLAESSGLSDLGSDLARDLGLAEGG